MSTRGFRPGCLLDDMLVGCTGKDQDRVCHPRWLASRYCREWWHFAWLRKDNMHPISWKGVLGRSCGAHLSCFSSAVSRLSTGVCRHQARGSDAAGRELGFPGGQVRVARCWWPQPHVHGEKPPLHGDTGTKLCHKHRLGGVQIQYKLAFAWKGRIS